MISTPLMYMYTDKLQENSAMNYLVPKQHKRTWTILGSNLLFLSKSKYIMEMDMWSIMWKVTLKYRL